MWAQTRTFLNPILPGFYPDPSICRVGTDYYLINSTFAYFPGVPVFHSKDLVNWNQIGHVLDRHEQLDLMGLSVSEGIFAPSLHYNQGLFYMITTLVGNGGNFVVVAKEASGPWTNPVWLPKVTGIDPSLFFDVDGKAYVIFNSGPPEDKPLYEGHRAIWMYEFEPKTLKTIGERKLLVNGGVNISKKPIWIEGPHLLKKDGYYYLLAAEGGTGFDHSEVVFRSKSINGPFEPYDKNPILTQRHLDPNRPYPITSTGHASLVETLNGEWWAVFLGCRPHDLTVKERYNIGRETWMAPVKWTNGWPVINPDFAAVQYRYPAPMLPPTKVKPPIRSGNFKLKDDFTSTKLVNEWLFLRTPNEKWFRLTAPRGSLTLLLKPTTLTEKGNPAFITRRQQHAFGEASTLMRFVPKQENELAGLVAFYNESHHYILGKTMEQGKVLIQLVKSAAHADSAAELLAVVELKPDQAKKPLYLKIEAKGNFYAFYYSLEPEKWIVVKDQVDGTFLSTQVAGGFVGTTLGLYASAYGEESKNKASFNWFLYSGNDPVYQDNAFLTSQGIKTNK